jgi:hypothetical protein
VHGSVAADDDEQRRALVGGCPRELSEVTRALGEDRLAAQTGCVSRPRDLRPALPRLPVRRRRVDQEDRCQR